MPNIRKNKHINLYCFLRHTQIEQLHCDTNRYETILKYLNKQTYTQNATESAYDVQENIAKGQNTGRQLPTVHEELSRPISDSKP